MSELSHHDYNALIFSLENTDANTARGVRSIQTLQGIDWRSLIAEMKEMKTLAPHPQGFRFET